MAGLSLGHDRYWASGMRVIGFAGWSGSGKTTLVTKLIPLLRGRGLTVSTIKHAHHKFDIDRPGKDSYEHRRAGASEVLISSANRFALMRELRDEAEWSLAQLLGKLSPVDLVIVEGYKTEPHPKIEVWRPVVGRPPLSANDPFIRALAAKDPPAAIPVPVIDLDATDEVADAVLRLSEPLADVAKRCEAQVR